MPDAAKSMFEALKTCKVLGGDLDFPYTEPDVLPFVANIKSKLADSTCRDYVWSNYYRNEYAGKNWTVYESEATFLFPPYENAGWLEWAVGQPNGKHFQPCAGVDIDQNLFYDLDCEDKGYCYVCR